MPIDLFPQLSLVDLGFDDFDETSGRVPPFLVDNTRQLCLTVDIESFYV
jgi:hypothetical protein